MQMMKPSFLGRAKMNEKIILESRLMKVWGNMDFIKLRKNMI
jgi:hypothetical protein